MIRLFSPPGIVSGLVVMGAVASGVMFGAGAAAAMLVACAARQHMAKS